MCKFWEFIVGRKATEERLQNKLNNLQAVAAVKQQSLEVARAVEELQLAHERAKKGEQWGPTTSRPS